jgi:uracil-DNA glycosylase family 4
MLVGEGPGQHEDEQGEPFVGPAGAPGSAARSRSSSPRY